MLRNSKRNLVLLILAVIVLLGTFLSGCSNAPVSNPPDTQQDINQETPKEEGGKEEQKPDTPSTLEITDMAGRKVTVPAEVNKVFSTGPVTAIYVYTVNPDKLLGWNYELNVHERKYVLPKYHDIPSFGMGDSINYEAVIEAKPDIAINVSALNDASIAEADKLSESIGIPVVIVDNNLEKAADVYRFLGELLGEKEQADKLAAFAEKTFGDIKAANIPEEKKVTIYYGNGVNSLETAPKGSSHAQIFDMVGAINVADLEAKSGGRVQVSLEQILAWNPEFMVVNGEPKQDMTGNAAAEEIKKNPDFATIVAVKEGNVFGSPKAPFSWVDRPPGPNRIIGLRWLAAKLYPEYYTYNVDEEVKEFFKLFYHLDLTDEMLSELYND